VTMRCLLHNTDMHLDVDCGGCGGDGFVADLDDVIGGARDRCSQCGGSGITYVCQQCIDESDENTEE
jgi:hypothetical protein